LLYEHLHIDTKHDAIHFDWMIKTYSNIRPRSITVSCSIHDMVHPGIIYSILESVPSQLDSLTTGKMHSRLFYTAFCDIPLVHLTQLTCSLVANRHGHQSYLLSHQHIALALASMPLLSSLNLTLPQHPFMKPTSSMVFEVPKLLNMCITCSTGALRLLELVSCPVLVKFHVYIINMNLEDRSIQRISSFLQSHSSISNLGLGLPGLASTTLSTQSTPTNRLLRVISTSQYSQMTFMRNLPNRAALGHLPKDLQLLCLPAMWNRSHDLRTIDCLDIIPALFPKLTIQICIAGIQKSHQKFLWPQRKEHWVAGYQEVGLWYRKHRGTHQLIDEAGNSFPMNKLQYIRAVMV
jgi:hypothetical protein